MIIRYFNRKWKNRTIVDELYRQLTERARDPVYYSRMQVPDTVMGRFEMLSVIMILFFRRAKAIGPAVESLGQDMIDTFFLDIDHSIRELGVGDVGVPKRMKKLARMFYGRAQSYEEALDAGDISALARHLRRNIHPLGAGEPSMPDTGPDMTALAEAVIDLDERFRAVRETDLLSGVLWPNSPAAPGTTETG